MNILYYTEIIGVGGVENMMLQWISNADPDVHIDIFVRKVEDENNRQRFLQYGCEIFEADCDVKNFIKKAIMLSKVLKRKKYDILHVHTAWSLDFFALAVAKKQGVQCRIAHSHNAVKFRHLLTKMANKLCRPFMLYYATALWGCSKQAAISIFGSKHMGRYVVIKNGINIQDYSFSMQNRMEIRREFGISENEFVIGSVGRLDYQKNYDFLLKILSELKYKKIKILIIGEGEERKELSQFAKKHNLDLSMPGRRDDVSKILNCFDIFALTSRYEGLGIVVLEAQSNGLKCIVSDAVPKEAIVYPGNISLSLNNKQEWIDTLQVESELYQFSVLERERRSKIMMESDFDIVSCSKELMSLYKTMVRNI